MKLNHYIIIFSLLFNLMAPCYAGCFMVAAYRFKLDPRLIYAIAKNESSLKNTSLHINENGTYDIGIMQINSVHLSELEKKGIYRNDLLNECKNIMIGGWILRNSIDVANGDIWKGVGFYHSKNIKYSIPYVERVKKIYFGMELSDLNKLREK